MSSVNTLIARGMFCDARHNHHTFTPIIFFLITTTANKHPGKKSFIDKNMKNPTGTKLCISYIVEHSFVYLFISLLARFQALEMIGYIRDSLKQMIFDVSWMDDATKDKALEKVSDDVISTAITYTVHSASINLFSTPPQYLKHGK